MTTVTLARNAMATRFEIVLHGQNPVSLRAAGEEALAEIERLEAQLSLFRPASEIAHLNARAAREPVRVSPPVFFLLQHAAKLSLETNGAFDITIAPLVRAWGFLSGGGRTPHTTELASLQQCVGMHLVEFNAEDYTIRFARQGVMLDLGAIGKGYAIDRAMELLREAGVESALLHGGTSTVYALGAPPDAEAWQLGLPLPEAEARAQPLSGVTQGQTSASPLLTYKSSLSSSRTLKIPLRNEALSVSAVWGRFFRDKGQTLGHIIDPRTGRPAQAASMAAVVLPSATESDALSTALLTVGTEGHSQIVNLRQSIRTLVTAGAGPEARSASHGMPSFTSDFSAA